MHEMKGSPAYPGSHLQTGLCLMTSQPALVPHAPRQGFLHVFWVQAKLIGQSVLFTHSGPQLGGDPTYPSRHAQIAILFNARHLE